MKKSSIIFSLFTLLALGALSSCSHENSNSATIEEITTKEPTYTPPTADALEVTSNLKTYVFDGDYNAEGQAIVNRIKTKLGSISDDVQTIIMPGTKISSLTSSDYLAITKAYIKGANLLVTKPTVNQFTQLFTGMNTALDEIFKDNIDDTSNSVSAPFKISASAAGFISNQADKLKASSRADTPYNPFSTDETTNPNESFCEAMAFNDNDCYFMKTLKSEEEITQTNPIVTYDDKGNEVSRENKVYTQTHTMNNYEYGLYADEAVTWLNELTQAAANAVAEKNMGREIASRTDIPSSSLTEDDNAQKSSYTLPVHPPYYAGDAAATVTYYIWAYHKIDTGDDLYLFHSKLSMPTADLAYGRMPNEYGNAEKIPYKKLTTLESSTFSITRLYGPFLRSVSLRNELIVPGGNIILQDNSPHTANGTTHYEFGYNISATGGASTEQGLSVGLTGGYSKKWSYDVPDLSMTDRTSGVVQACNYTGSITPNSGSFTINITAVKEILRTTVTLPSVAAWIVQSPTDGDCQMKMSGNICIGSEKLKANYYVLWIYTYSSNWDMDNNFEKTITFAAPPHYLYKWDMFVTATANAKKLESYLMGKYPSYYASSMSYSERKNSNKSKETSMYTNASSQWNNLISEVENANEMGTIKGNGVPAGTYTINMNGQTANPAKFSYTFTVK